MPIVRPFDGKHPRVDNSSFLAETAVVVGDVVIGPRSSVWYGVVLRGDVHYIRIGANVSVQDNTVVHVTHDKHPTVVGDGVTVGHGAILHGCTIGDRCLIGMGAIVMDDVVVGDDCVVAAGALVTPGTKIPSGHLVMGSPAQVKRTLNEEERAWLVASAQHYVDLTKRYLAEDS